MKTDSLVRYPASARPSMGGRSARVPVATTAFVNLSLAPATSTVRRSTKAASPRNTSTPMA